MPEENQPQDELHYILPELRQFAVDIDDLLQDPENTAAHDPRNLKIVAESIKRFKQRRVAIFNEEKIDGELKKVIKVGNGMHEAMRLMGFKKIAAVGTKDKRKEAMAYGMVDNRSSALTGVNYDQMSKNIKELSKDKHPMLDLMFNEEERVPFLHETFTKKEIIEKEFDPSLLKGRAVTKISITDREHVDRAIKFVRFRDGKGMTEGACLSLICQEFISNHLDEFDNSGLETVEEEPDLGEANNGDWLGDAPSELSGQLDDIDSEPEDDGGPGQVLFVAPEIKGDEIDEGGLPLDF